VDWRDRRAVRFRSLSALRLPRLRRPAEPKPPTTARRRHSRGGRSDTRRMWNVAGGVAASVWRRLPSRSTGPSRTCRRARHAARSSTRPCDHTLGLRSVASDREPITRSPQHTRGSSERGPERAPSTRPLLANCGPGRDERSIKILALIAVNQLDPDGEDAGEEWIFFRPVPVFDSRRPSRCPAPSPFC